MVIENPQQPMIINVVQPDSAAGMSIRDYFAGQALVGILASSTIEEELDNKTMARWAYTLAEAMIEQRNMPCT